MRLRLHLSLILAILFGGGACYHYFGLLVPLSRRLDTANNIGTRYRWGGDLYPIWLTGRDLLWHRTNPYTREMTQRIQIGLYGRTMNPTRPFDQPEDYRAFSYPLYTDLLAAPLLPFNFEVVRLVMAVLLVPLTAASLIFWLRFLGVDVQPIVLATIIVLTLTSYPVLEGMYLQQAALWAGAALALSMAALVRGRLAIAGMALALASVKPQMVWLIALFLGCWSLADWKHRKNLALSFLFTSAILFLACEIILPGWLAGWIRTVAGYSAYTLPPLPRLVLGKFLGPVLTIAVLGLAGAMAWKTRRSEASSDSFLLSVCFILSATEMLLPSGGAVYDQVVMLPGILWLWLRREQISRGSPPLRVMGLVTLIALGWQWIMASGVAVMSLISSATAQDFMVLVFPTRMAASLPFVVIVLLAFFAVHWLRKPLNDSEIKIAAAVLPEA